MRATVYGAAAAIALSERIRHSASSPQASHSMHLAMRQAHQTGAQNRGDYNRSLDWSIDVERTIQRRVPEHLQDILQLAHIDGLSRKKIAITKSISMRRTGTLMDQADAIATEALIEASLIMCPVAAYGGHVAADQPTTIQLRHRGTARARPRRRCRGAAVSRIHAVADNTTRSRNVQRQVSELTALGRAMHGQDERHYARLEAVRHMSIRMGIPTMHLAPSVSVAAEWTAKVDRLHALLQRAYARSGSRTIDKPSAGLALPGAPRAARLEWSNIDRFIEAAELAERYDRAGKDEAEALRELPTSTN